MRSAHTSANNAEDVKRRNSSERRTRWVVKVISSARAMKNRPPSIVRSASSWSASKGSISRRRPATSSAPSASSSTK